jgi:hypothetical protein
MFSFETERVKLLQSLHRADGFRQFRRRQVHVHGARHVERNDAGRRFVPLLHVDHGPEHGAVAALATPKWSQSKAVGAQECEKRTQTHRHRGRPQFVTRTQRPHHLQNSWSALFLIGSLAN